MIVAMAQASKRAPERAPSALQRHIAYLFCFFSIENLTAVGSICMQLHNAHVLSVCFLCLLLMEPLALLANENRLVVPILQVATTLIKMDHLTVLRLPELGSQRHQFPLRHLATSCWSHHVPSRAASALMVILNLHLYGWFAVPTIGIFAAPPTSKAKNCHELQCHHNQKCHNNTESGA